MWRQDDIIGALDSANRKRLPPEVDLDVAEGRIRGPGPRNLPAAPLMHGTGLFNAFSNLMVAGSVHTLAGRHFDVVELLDTVQASSINSMSIVGDAFAKPMLRALDAEPVAVGHLVAARARLERRDVERRRRRQGCSVTTRG